MGDFGGWSVARNMFPSSPLRRTAADWRQSGADLATKSHGGLRLLFVWLFALAASCSLWGAADDASARKRFDLPRTDAEKALREFSTQSGVQVLFSTDAATGVRTNEVKGEYTPREALGLLLQGTALTFSERNGTWMIARKPRVETPDRAKNAQGRRQPRERQAGGDQQVASISEDTVHLSPFEVSSEKDVGYSAENTLSGSRLNTALKDTPAMITVFTEELIRDLGVTDLNDLVRYDANVQMESFDSQGASNSGTFNSAVPTQRDTYRSRGLPGTYSRDFFSGYASQDNYNVSRVDFSKGPNGVLFGIGAIGGVLSTSIDRANVYRDATELELQVGSWGYHRGTVDTNKVLIPKKAALRVNLLGHRANGYRYHTFTDKDRATISGTLHPFKNTTIRAAWEFGTDKKSNQRPFGPADGVSEWVAAGRPLIAYGAGTTGTNGGRGIAQDTNGIGVRNNAPFMVYVEGVGLYNEARGGTVTPFNDLLTDPVYRINYQGRRLYDDPAQFGELAISNRVAGGGPDAWAQNKTNNVLLTVEQTITPDLVAEVSYFYDKLKTYGQNPGAVQLRADPNPLIGNANGTVDRPFAAPYGTNPNVGGYYFENDWQVEKGDREQEALRAVLAYNLDLGRRFSGVMGKIFGRQRLAVGGEINQQKIIRDINTEVLDYAFTSLGWNGTGANNTTHPLGFQRFNMNNPSAAANVVTRRKYVTFGDWENFYTGRFPTTNQLSLTQVPGTTVKTVWVPGGANNISDDIIDGDVYMGALQSYFFNDYLVTTLGYRSDTIDVADAPSVRDSPATTGGPVDYNQNGMINEFVLLRDRRDITHVRAVSRSLGGVVHLTPRKNLSLFFNHSSGTSLPAVNQQVPPDGRIGSGQSGESNDYGVIFSLLDNRLSGRVARYETTEQNRFFFQVAGSNQMATNVLTILEGVTGPNGQPLVSSQERDAHTVNFNGSTGDGSSRGYEVQIRYNPSRNITLSLAYSKTDRTLTNIMGDLQSFVDAQTAFYTEKLALVGATTRSAATSNGQNLLSTTRTPSETIQDEIDRVNNAIVLFRSSREFGFGEAPHKVVGTGRYLFTHGPLKGLSFGGSAQWLSPTQLGPKIRYNDLNGNFSIDTGELVLDSNGRPISDGSYRGNEFFNVDVFATYRLTQVFGRKLNMEIQLNVRNLLDETDIIKQSLNNAATGLSQYAYRDPRNYRLTLRWKF